MQRYAFEFKQKSLRKGIRLIYTARHPIFLSSFAVNDLDLVERLCRDVYFPVGKITVGQVTSMHGILLFLLREYKALDDPLTHEYDIDAQISQCEQNFVAGLETYDILAIPSFENILALVMGVSAHKSQFSRVVLLENLTFHLGFKSPRRGKAIFVLHSHILGLNSLPNLGLPSQGDLPKNEDSRR